MIKTQVLSQIETLVQDYSNTEFTKWISEIKDIREVKDLGHTAINIFGLDKRNVKPIYLSAKSFTSGTTVISRFRVLLNNRDFVKFTSTEIISLAERDDLEPIKPTFSLFINDESIDFKDFGLRDRFLSGNISLDFVRDFYFNYWIPSENQKNSPIF